MTDMSSVAVVVSERLARYGFGDGHPFGPDRLAAFVREFDARGLDKRVRVLEPRTASDDELRSFHTPAYLEFVRERSQSGCGFLDAGDTPAFRGVYEAAAGAAEGTKLNVPLPPGADDEVFARVWPHVIAHLEKFAPEFIILQCGADSLEGDPITHLRFSPRVHGRAAKDLGALADRLGHGRVLALGGGGYNRDNLAQAWTAVVENLL